MKTKTQYEMRYQLKVLGNDDYDFVRAMEECLHYHKKHGCLPRHLAHYNKGGCDFDATLTTKTLIED